MVRPVTDEELGLRVLYDEAGAAPRSEGGSLVDIVAVHGMGAHPDDTWCRRIDGKDGSVYVNWLKDLNMLPAVAPCARIMRYGYSSQWFGKDAIKTKTSDISQAFLLDLKECRENDPSRPLILIGHSFGGLVLLKTLVDAHVERKNWPGIYDSTVGLVFLGTPFRGTHDSLSQGEILEEAYALFTGSPVYSENLGILRAGGEPLTDLVDMYLRIARQSERPRVACFYEQRASEVGGILRKDLGKKIPSVILVNENSGSLDLSEKADKYALPRTHFNIQTFGSPEEQGFRHVRSVIRKMIDEGPQLVSARAQCSTPAWPSHAVHFSHPSLKPVKAFVLRPSLRDQIRTQLWDGIIDESTRTLVVWGLGGTGKTQLVLDYIRQFHTDYKATFWIEAGRKESLERNFVNLYQTFFGVQTAAGSETISVDRAVTGVKSWFYSQQGPWLMVFDGADAIDNERSSEYIDIKHFIPDVASLHVIVTSRSSIAKDMARLDGVQVGEMETAQAAELFYRYSRLPRNDEDVGDEILAIVKELGNLALAVTLASTYVGRTPRLQSDIRAYLPEYRERRRELLRRKPESLIHQYSDSVFTTWETSYQAVRNECPEAAVLMTMLSFLNYDDIFLQLFSVERRMDEAELTQNEAARVTWRSMLFPKCSVDMYKMEECFEVLQKYSLAQWKDGQRGYSIHKLVHAWGHDRLSKNERCKYSRAALEIVTEAIDVCGSASKDKIRLVPHVMANFDTLAGTSGTWDQAADDIHILNGLSSVGTFVAELGRLTEGSVIRKYVLDESRRILGDEHPDTISAMGNLANTLSDLGQLDKAAKMMKEVLEKTRCILGEEHPDTVSAMGNLANAIGDLDQLDEAARMMKEVLEKTKRILGDEHPNTILAMNNLAYTLGTLGQLDEAANMMKEALEKMEYVLGDEHPNTISAMNNLATLLGDLGQFDEAAKMMKGVLEKRKRILGNEHPDTIAAMNNLASVFGTLGQFHEAAKMMKEVLEKTKRILGDEHPNTISAMNNLAFTLGNLGQLDEAIILLETTVQRMKQIHGDGNPRTKTAIRNLSMLTAQLTNEARAGLLDGRK